MTDQVLWAALMEVAKRIDIIADEVRIMRNEQELAHEHRMQQMQIKAMAAKPLLRVVV